MSHRSDGAFERAASIVGQRANEHCQISALPLDFGLTLMIACQDAVLSAIPVTEIAGVTRRRCTTTCTAMLIGADNEHRSSPAECDVGARWCAHWGWRVGDRRRLHSTPPRSTAAGRA